FFRLNTFEIFLPPLRERKADINALAKHLLARYASRRGLSQATIVSEALEVLQTHAWPGNIRELANMIERATILAGDSPILPQHLPTQLPVRGKLHATSTSSNSPAIGPPHFPIPEGTPTLRDIEMRYIQLVLEKHHGNKPAASRELGISLKTLYNKIN